MCRAKGETRGVPTMKLAIQTRPCVKVNQVVFILQEATEIE